MISSGSHCVATLICKGVRDRVREVGTASSGRKVLADEKLGCGKGEEAVVGATFRQIPETEQTLRENQVKRNSLPLLPCKYQAGRVVTEGLGTTGLETGYTGSWSPGHG